MESATIGRDQDVEWVVTNRDGRQCQAARHDRRHILQAVDGGVDVLAQQGCFELFDEHAGAPLWTWLIGALRSVPAGHDWYDLNLEHGVRLTQRRCDEASLGAGQRAWTCSESDYARAHASLASGGVRDDQLAVDDTRQCNQKIGRRVRRFDADQRFEPGGARLVAPGDVDVVQRLQVIGQELHGRDDGLLVAAARQLREDIQQVGLEPFFGRVACALVTERPLLEWQFSGVRQRREPSLAVARHSPAHGRPRVGAGCVR